MQSFRFIQLATKNLVQNSNKKRTVGVFKVSRLCSRDSVFLYRNFSTMSHFKLNADAVRVQVSQASTLEGLDLCVIPICEESVSSSKDEAKVLNLSLTDALFSTTAPFKAKLGETKCILKNQNQSVVIVGSGTMTYSDFHSAALLGKRIAEQFENGTESVGIACTNFWRPSSHYLEVTLRSVLRHRHVNFRHKSSGSPSSVNKVVLVHDSNSKIPEEEFSTLVNKSKALADGLILCSELVSAPANIATPEALASVAKEIEDASDGLISTKILERSDCERLGMGAYLAVARGSELPPKFIHMKYSNGTPTRKIAFVGKGLTFDSGGYNIKAGASSLIELMKFDMGGAGAVIGAARAISLLKPVNKEIHFIVASCENMISGNSVRPGDIIQASNGKTIEVNNTDAEGRLTLADGLVYAAKQGVDDIIDLATLTGACVVALGEEYAGLFSPSNSFAREIENAAASSGELIHRLPLHERYRDQLKSNVADMKNTGSSYAGSITAALFLKAYVSDDVNWAHLDIAGPVWDSKKEEGTGFGVASLVELILNDQANSKM